MATAFPNTNLKFSQVATLSGQLRAGQTILVTFAFGSAELDETARGALDVQARWLAANPDLLFTVTGSADRVGPDALNRDLGLARAHKVAEYLASVGIAPERITVIATTGEEKPLYLTDDETRFNRYVAISYILPDGGNRAFGAADPFKDGPAIVAVLADNAGKPPAEGESGGDAGGSSGGNTGGSTENESASGGAGGDTGGTGGDTGGTGGDTGGAGDDTGGTGGDSGGTGGDTGGTGGDTGGTGGDTGGTGGDTGGTGGDTGGTGGDTGGTGGTGGSTGGTGGNGGNGGNGNGGVGTGSGQGASNGKGH